MKNYRVFDAHCDTMRVVWEKNENLKETSCMVGLNMLKKYSGFTQIFAAWINSKEGNPLAQAVCIADKFYEEISRNQLTPIFDAETLTDVVTGNKLGAILALEDGAALCGDIRVLNMLHKLGFRAVTLTWNGSNELGDGAVDSEGKGLTAFGKDVVRKMNELGMVVDVSHLSERGFWDVIELSSKPIMASHSNARAICDHPRNLSDEQLRALIKNNGAVGINLYNVFLNGTNDASMTDVIRHIEHILSLGGENIIGMGADYDGMDFAAKGIENAGKLCCLFDELSKLGYSDELIEKLTYKNFVRVFSECLR
ncbi:MAG: dipeptidase [Oscillospiraceae bacterium]|nr:dipeptidase [Oscillospiraceae bacterium]